MVLLIFKFYGTLNFVISGNQWAHIEIDNIKLCQFQKIQVTVQAASLKENEW